MDERRVILGIDPGTNFMGYAVIDVQNKIVKIDVIGVVDVHLVKNNYDKLERIYHRVSQIVNEYSPTELAIEAPFFGKNIQSMLKLGRAQGVIMAATFQKEMKIVEYAPREVKQMITGQGEASKEKVALFLSGIFPDSYQQPQTLDATDALAIAYAHYLASTSVIPQRKKNKNNVLKKSDWASYIQENPNKVEQS